MSRKSFAIGILFVVLAVAGADYVTARYSGSRSRVNMQAALDTTALQLHRKAKNCTPEQLQKETDLVFKGLFAERDGAKKIRIVPEFHQTSDRFNLKLEGSAEVPNSFVMAAMGRPFFKINASSEVIWGPEKHRQADPC